MRHNCCCPSCTCAVAARCQCPFCQRVLLTMEVKKVPYSKVYIDFDNKPEW